MPRCRRTEPVRLWSRLGNDKTSQFPEIAAALTRWARRRRSPVVLDGEIVALDAKGQPTGFQQLQGRIHVAGEVETLPGDARVAFIAFDLLRDGTTDLRDRPMLERRAALERLMLTKGDKAGILRLSELVRGDGRALYDRAIASGWEGLIAKHVDSRYQSGKRTPDWRKLKIVQRTGIRRRRLDRAEKRAHAILARCCSASTRQRPRLCRSHRHRIR